MISEAAPDTGSHDTSSTTPQASQPTLRLTPPEPAHPDSYLLERRRATRRNYHGKVTAVRSQRDTEGTRNHICSVQLIDISDTGLGALVHEPVDPDCSIALFFQPHGPERGFDLTGHVVRCHPTPAGYRIGIRLDSRAAA